MKRLKRMRFTCLRVFLAGILCVAFSAIGVAVPVLGAESARVFDQAGLFDAAEIETLEAAIATTISNTKMDLVVVTTADAQGKSGMAYADDFYDENGFGTDEDLSGALLLIDMEHREIHISTAGKMIDFLTDANIETILDSVYSDVGIENYSGAAQSFLDGVGHFVDEGIENGQYRYDTETGQITRHRSISPLWFVVSLLVALLAGGLSCASVAWKYQMQTPAYSYPFREKGNLNLSCREDRFLNKTLTQRRIPKPSDSNGSGGSSGQSSVHTSSGGTSHGGGGRKF